MRVLGFLHISNSRAIEKWHPGPLYRGSRRGYLGYGNSFHSKIWRKQNYNHRRGNGLGREYVDNNVEEEEEKRKKRKRKRKKRRRRGEETRAAIRGFHSFDMAEALKCEAQQR